MKSETLLSFIGDGSGLIGALAGAAGAIMGYISIRRTRELKATDLRIDLRKAANALHALTDELPAILNNAKMSRETTPFFNDDEPYLLTSE